MPRERDTEPSSNAPIVTAFCFAGAVIAGGTGFYFWLMKSRQAELPEGWGPLGDSLAPVVGLLTALALFAALWSIHLQRKDLRATLNEMADQRPPARLWAGARRGRATHVSNA